MPPLLTDAEIEEVLTIFLTLLSGQTVSWLMPPMQQSTTERSGTGSRLSKVDPSVNIRTKS